MFKLAIEGKTNITACGPIVDSPAHGAEIARNVNPQRIADGLKPFPPVYFQHGGDQWSPNRKLRICR